MTEFFRLAAIWLRLRADAIHMWELEANETECRMRGMMDTGNEMRLLVAELRREPCITMSLA